MLPAKQENPRLRYRSSLLVNLSFMIFLCVFYAPALFSRGIIPASKPENAQAKDSSFPPGLVGCELNTNSIVAKNITLACHARSGLVMAIQGNYAYLALGSKLQILDLSRPAALQVTSELDFSAGAGILGLDVFGDYLYWVNSFGMYIIDISNPARPFQMGVFQIPSYQPPFGFIEVTGDYAYLTVTTSNKPEYRVALIDVSDPYNPIQIGDYLPVPDGRIQVVGKYAYIAHAGSQEYIAIYDISDPTNPTFVSSYPADHLGWYIGDNYMYLTVLKWDDGSWDGSELQIVDVSDPKYPTLVGSYRTTFIMSGLVNKDNYVYVGSDKEVLVLDISNPANPTKVGSYNHPGSIINVIGNYAYAFDYYEGFTILDVSTPAMMAAVGTYYSANTVSEAIAIGDYAYIAYPGGLWVLDTSDINAPTLAGWLPSVIPVSMEISGTLAYVAENSRFDEGIYSYQSIHLVDLTDPIAPAKLGKYATAYDVEPFTPHIAPTGDYVYYYPGAGRLLVLNISDVMSPQAVNSLSTPGLQDIVTKGKGLYYADTHTMHIADISNPVQPTIVDTIPISNTQDLVINGNYLYNLTSDSLHVWDISTTITPTEIAILPIGGTRLAIEGRYAFINSNSGLQVLDISNPNMCLQVGFSSMTGSEISVKDSIIYLSRGDEGLNIARFTGISQTFIPNEKRSIVYTDTQGFETNIQAPIGAFSSTSVLLYSPSPLHPPTPSEWADANHAFELSAFTGGDGLVTSGSLSFLRPLTVTIRYSDQDIALIKDRSQLTLMYWNDDVWVNSSTMYAFIINAIDDNRIEFPLYHTGIYALIGPTNQVFLPYNTLYFHK